jgi:hypothetical protein
MSFIRFTTEEHRERRRAERAATHMAPFTATLRPVSSAVMGGTTTGPAPKSPADRNQAVRDLAMGEDCQVRYQPVCRRDPLYTVWAHTNTQADQKGMGYKGHDSEGVLACDRCHEVLDAGRDRLGPIQLQELWRGAKQRTLIRLRFIANSIAERPWRVRAARWAVQQLESRKP